jgi:hypothetical protein
MAKVLYPQAVPVVEKVAANCIRNPAEGLVAFSDTLPLRDGFLTVRMAAVEPWGTIMKENSTGAARIPVPVFLSQGTNDEVVHQQITALYGGVLCAQGTAVRYLSVPDESHMLVAFHTATATVAWMADRFAGKPAPDECVKPSR